MRLCHVPLVLLREYVFVFRPAERVGTFISCQIFVRRTQEIHCLLACCLFVGFAVCVLFRSHLSALLRGWGVRFLRFRRPDESETYDEGGGYDSHDGDDDGWGSEGEWNGGESSSGQVIAGQNTRFF